MKLTNDEGQLSGLIQNQICYYTIMSLVISIYPPPPFLLFLNIKKNLGIDYKIHNNSMK